MTTKMAKKMTISITEAVETLLYGPHVRNEVEKAIAVLVPGRLHAIFKSEGPTYLVGNGGDFREYTVPIAKELDAHLEGVACLWPHRMEFPTKEGIWVYSITNECIEAPSGCKPTVIFCQSIMSDANELLSMVNRIRYVVEPQKLIFSSALYNEHVAEEVLGSVAIDADFDGIAVDTSLEGQQRAVFDALDDRPVKIAPLMSRWLAMRFFGPEPKRRLVKTNTPKW